MSDQFSREMVPEAAASKPAWSLFLIVANATMGVPVMILGIEIGSDYGAYRGAFVLALGCAITALLTALAAHAGVKSRRSTALLASHAFGSSGAHLINLAIAVALLGWFAVEMGFIGAMIADSTRIVFGETVGRTPGIIVASIFICAVCIAGIGVISRVPLLFLPFLAVLLMSVLFLTAQRGGVDWDASVTDRSLGTGVSAIVGAYIVGCLITPDYSRFIKSSQSAALATVIALGPIYALVLGTYGLSGIVTSSSQPSAILTDLGLPSIIALILPIGLMQNGIMCLYSSSLATATLFKSLPFKVVVVILTSMGVLLALLGADSFFVNFLVILGILFPPALALLIHAGLIAKSDGAVMPSWKWPQLALWCFGIVCGAASQWLGFGLTGFSAFDGFLGAALGAVILHFFRNEHVANTIQEYENL